MAIPEVVGDGLLNGQKRAFKMRMPDVRPCPAVDACHGPGVRDARTGVCSSPALADGTTCNDGSACTSGDHGGVTGTSAACPGASCCGLQATLATGVTSVLAVADGTLAHDEPLHDAREVQAQEPAFQSFRGQGRALPTDNYYAPLVDIGSTQG